ncbi:MAG: zinc ABC transporter substrate-binding protein [Bacilli bacterium]|nr:zinc ABC transporter substrate-binding protein [Bacilli bacterium]
MKKYLSLLIILLILFFVVGCGNRKSNSKYTIMTSNFPCYDFARAIVKDTKDVDVKMLLKPGSEMHDFEPTPQDIINIQNSDIFIYVGGESDEWINDVLSDIDTSKTKIIKIMDYVDLIDEDDLEVLEDEEEESEEGEEEYDEHIWTSPVNVMKIISKLKEEIINMDKENSSKYEANAENYIKQLEEIDTELKNIVASSKRKEIVVGDRFPFIYFTKEYGISYTAAFKGCSDQSEASAKTISYLIDKVKKDNIPVILKIELSNGNIANTIREETGAKVLQFSSAHNISQVDFDKGVTYVDIMKGNIEVIKEALN